MDAIQLIGVDKTFNIRPRSLKEFLPLRARGLGAEAFHALRDVTLSMPQGSTTGIIGRNGSGKSTLLKIAAGVTPPTRGTVVLRGRISPLLELGAGFSAELSGRENIFLNGTILGMTRSLIASRVEAILDFAELDEFADLPVKRYSTGMITRLGFAIAMYSDPDILLLDEILAVGDELFREKCFSAIRGFQQRGVTTVFVSHSLEMVIQFCDRTVVLDHGRVRFDGDPAAAASFYRQMIGSPTAG